MQSARLTAKVFAVSKRVSPWSSPGLCRRATVDSPIAQEGDMGDKSRLNHEVFISYSSKDKQWADGACAVLEKHRIRCWVAPRDITPGTEWQASIMKGLNESRIMVLIFSR